MSNPPPANLPRASTQMSRVQRADLQNGRMAALAPTLLVQPYQTAAAGPLDTTQSAYGLEWFDDIELATDSPYIVKGVLDQGAMSVIYGPSNCGKTFFAMDLAFYIANGFQWRSRRVKQATVLYLAAEGGRGILNRAVAMKLENGVQDVPMAIKRAGLDLLRTDADIERLCALSHEVATARPDAPRVIVIDTLSRVMAGGDENNATDITALIRNIDAVREAAGAHVSLVHHTGKDTTRGARGHSSLRAATDTEIEVGNKSGTRAAVVTKQRDSPGGKHSPLA